MTPLSDMRTSTEAAEDLGIDRGTLTRWVQAGKITPSFERPGIRLFEPDEIARVKLEIANASPTP